MICYHLNSWLLYFADIVSILKKFMVHKTSYTKHVEKRMLENINAFITSCIV
jgi:hypothetical protein